MTRRPTLSRVTVLLLPFLIIATAGSCGGGRPVIPRADAGAGSISGLVVKGRVSGASVTAFGLSTTGDRGAILATTTTDSAGAFTLGGLPSYNGPLLLVATGGSYPEEAVPSGSVRLESQELTFLVGSYTSGSTVQGLAITPVSHFAAGLASHWIKMGSKSVSQAAEEAWLHLNNHFGGLLGGGLDWRTVTPADLTAAGLGQLDAAGKAGVLLAALSMEARTMAESAGLTPGAALNSLTLVQALYADLSADGLFDGRGPEGPIILPSGGFVADAGPSATPLDDQTLRFTLGQALERFITSERNQSGLTPNDVLPLIQQLASNSDTILFPTAGLNYDHEPPVVSFAVKFTRDGTTLHDPVGALRLVGGTLTITADVSDASTIQSVALHANGKPLTTTSNGSGAHLTITGSLTTTADGPLTVTATSRDVHGNAGTTMYVLTVDNTPPSITITEASPTAGGFYSTSVPINITAADLNGVTSLTESGLANFVNLSGVVDRLTGTWTVPPSQPDGPLTVALTAIDTAFNTAAIPLTFIIDRTPPTVVLSAPTPPRYTSATAITLHVTAADLGAGVAAVKASVNGAPDVTVTAPTNGAWDISLNLGLEGNKQILIWAVDNAAPSPNSSYANALIVNVTRDATNPAPVVQTNVGSYFDERPGSTANGVYTPGMGLQLDSAGRPLVPAVYTFPASATKRPVVGAGDVYKVAPRLSWGAMVPTAAQLYAQNGASLNVPFLVYDVPVTNSEAPIDSVATYKITSTGATITSGQLIRDPSFAGNPQRFLLPLSTETAPDLSSASGLQTLHVHVEFTDAAGNIGADNTVVHFHVLGPPLAISEDTAYSAVADPRSIFAYRPGPAKNYTELFNPNNPAFTADGARVIRYIVQNPAPIPVALKATLGSGSYTHVEAWNDTVRNANSGHFPDAPGLYTFSFCTFPNWTPDPAPCGGATSGTPLSLYRGNLPSTCSMPYAQVPSESTWTTPAAVISSGALSSATTYQVPNDSSPALTVPNSQGYVLVPAATNSTPGMIAVYVNRPAASPRSVPIQLADVLSDSLYPLGANAYSYTVEDFWYPFGNPSYCCDTTDPDNPVCYTNGNQSYFLRRHAKYLATASSSISGTLNFTSQPVTSTGMQLLGEPSQLATSLPFSVSFNH